MPPTRNRAAARPAGEAPAPALSADVKSALAWLERKSTRHDLEGMARYGIPSDHALGVSMANMQSLARSLGRNHALAAALWETGVYEARMLATLIDEPERVTPAQMDRWCRDFDSWAICDTACFKLFDRSPHAWSRVAKWSGRRDEFGRRAAFALLACLALHDKESADASFLQGLRLVERAATDERNFVRKAVSWALRAVGERNPALHAAAVTLARRLAGSADATARWIGKDATRELARPAVLRRMKARRASGGDRSRAADRPARPGGTNARSKRGRKHA